MKKTYDLNAIIPETGKELTPEQKKALGDKYKDLGEVQGDTFPVEHFLAMSKKETLDWLALRVSKESQKDSKAKLSYIFQREWKNLKDNKVHIRRSCCICVSCLYQFYKLTHKHSRIRRDNFMFGWSLFRIDLPPIIVPPPELES